MSWGPLPELRLPLFACTVTSDEQMRPGREPRPAYGVNPRVLCSLESHFGPVSHEWLYRIARKIIETLKSYHDDNVRTQLVGIVTACFLSFI